MYRERSIIAALVLSLTLGACQAAPPTASPAASPISAVASPSPTPAPTAPPDVAALFADQAAALKSGVIVFSGTATIGAVQMTLSGDSTYTGGDSRGKTITTVAGEATVVDFVQVAGRRYVRTGDGPWLEVPAETAGDLSASLQKTALGSLTDEGAEERAGQTVHRLVPTAGAGIDPAAVLGSVSGATNLKVDLAFLAGVDGTPVGAIVDASWSQAVGETSVDAMLSLEMKFGSLGMPQTIRVPEDVWTMFTSSRFDVSFAYPGEFEYEKAKGYDQFWAPEYGGLYFDRVSARGYPLTTWTKGTLQYLKGELRNESTKSEAYTLDGTKARLLTATGKNKDGDKVTIYALLALKGSYIYDIEWIALAGNESVELATFKQVLGTFSFD